LALVKYNDSENRKTKLTKEHIREIRRKYNPYVYGKKRLANEYGVSVSVIYRIIKGVMWKNL
jgi:DNA invertase Pin-like site-specific DNA recombinase